MKRRTILGVLVAAVAAWTSKLFGRGEADASPVSAYVPVRRHPTGTVHMTRDLAMEVGTVDANSPSARSLTAMAFFAGFARHAEYVASVVRGLAPWCAGVDVVSLVYRGRAFNYHFARAGSEARFSFGLLDLRCAFSDGPIDACHDRVPRVYVSAAGRAAICDSNGGAPLDEHELDDLAFRSETRERVAATFDGLVSSMLNTDRHRRGDDAAERAYYLRLGFGPVAGYRQHPLPALAFERRAS